MDKTKQGVGGLEENALAEEEQEAGVGSLVPYPNTPQSSAAIAQGSAVGESNEASEEVCQGGDSHGGKKLASELDMSDVSSKGTLFESDDDEVQAVEPVKGGADLVGEGYGVPLKAVPWSDMDSGYDIKFAVWDIKEHLGLSDRFPSFFTMYPEKYASMEIATEADYAEFLRAKERGGAKALLAVMRNHQVRRSAANVVRKLAERCDELEQYREARQWGALTRRKQGAHMLGIYLEGGGEHLQEYIAGLAPAKKVCLAFGKTGTHVSIMYVSLQSKADTCLHDAYFRRMVGSANPRSVKSPSTVTRRLCLIRSRFLSHASASPGVYVIECLIHVEGLHTDDKVLAHASCQGGSKRGSTGTARSGAGTNKHAYVDNRDSSKQSPSSTNYHVGFMCVDCQVLLTEIDVVDLHTGSG